ncbi:SAYSvFN domain-containing protein 1 [Gouania willdenowi]|uniref:SAYSvFN domain-containing protein n=1 Tax=Gouania willdenowi TaxID=441366 RepID=A0A8C5H4P9_GOUWI|nr:SAYSvFN domain-containing protein 1 [Gouania willdenowi]
MEKKLLEFRAKRRAEKAANTSQSEASTPLEQTTAQTAETTEATDDRDLPNRAGNSREAAPADEGRDWFLDSSLGRWLASKRLVLSNVMLLKVLLWLVLLGLFAELEFGLPFFVISLFYWLYEGLRSPAPREPGELSAYSVFNPDCQPLLGSLTAEQLEGEMGYRPLANR